MMQLDRKWKYYADKENLKEMGDVTSGMATTVIQVFLNRVLGSFIHHSVQVDCHDYQEQEINCLRLQGPSRSSEGDPVDRGPGPGPPRACPRTGAEGQPLGRQGAAGHREEVPGVHSHEVDKGN